jgi:hypothetical protein
VTRSTYPARAARTTSVPTGAHVAAVARAERTTWSSSGVRSRASTTVPSDRVVSVVATSVDDTSVAAVVASTSPRAYETSVATCVVSM